MISDEEFLKVQALVVKRLVQGFPEAMRDVVAVHWIKENGWTMRAIIEALDHLNILYLLHSEEMQGIQNTSSQQ